MEIRPLSVDEAAKLLSVLQSFFYKLAELRIEYRALKIRGQLLPQMPVSPSGLRGYTGRGVFFSTSPHRGHRGGRSVAGILPKRAIFVGVQGASPLLNLIILQHLMFPEDVYYLSYPKKWIQ